MAVKYGFGPHGRHCPLCQTSMSKDGLAEPQHHGSEVRLEPAATSSLCQTLLSELPRTRISDLRFARLPALPAKLHPCQRTVSQSQNTMAVKYGSSPRPAAHTAKRCFLNCLDTSLRRSHSPAFLHCPRSSAQRTVSQSQNTMAVKYGSSPHPPAHCAKRCFLNCLETSLRPSIRPPSCTASEAPCQRTVSQSQNTMAVKYGSSPQPAAHCAKRCFLNCLETSLRPSIRPPSYTARETPCQRTVSQSQNTMAVKYGSSPRPAAHTAKRCFLNCL